MMGLTAEQLEIRKTGVGGSDIAVLLGLNPFKTTHELWLEKDDSYRTEKTDPGVQFITTIRKKTSKNNWKPIPEKN